MYKDFSYTEWPTDPDFTTLDHARIRYLAVNTGMKWRMKLTGHFMTNEAIDFAVEDGTAYHTLNEAPESFHQEVKVRASCSIKNIKQA